MGIVFALAPSLVFLKLFLYSSPGAYWASTNLASSSFTVISVLPFQLSAEQSLTGECWILPKKRYPMSQGKGEDKQDGRRWEIMFRIKPHTRQRCSEGSDKTLCTPGPKGSTETEPDLPFRV